MSKNKPTCKAAVLRTKRRVEREAAILTKNISREFAQDECKRALAAWVMAIRARIEEIHASVQKVFFDCSKEESLLHGLIDSKRLGDIYSALQDLDGDLPMLTLDCEIRDPVEIAANFKESWKL